VIINACLFHYAIGDMADTDFTIDWKVSAGDRAMPDVMIALTVPYKITAVFPQNLPDLFFILRHSAASLIQIGRVKKIPSPLLALCYNRLGFHLEQQVHIGMGLPIHFQKLRCGQFYPADQGIKGGVLKYDGYIVILGVPFPGFLIPG
jgi:hypothetical protein